MELTFNSLKTRDVVNVTDGRCLGKPIDIKLVFPSGTLIGITVQGKRKNFFQTIFDKSSLYIEEKKIIKIGNDVILVNLKCGDVCDENVILNKKPKSDGCSPCVDFQNAENIRIDTADY